MRRANRPRALGAAAPGDEVVRGEPAAALTAGGLPRGAAKAIVLVAARTLAYPRRMLVSDFAVVRAAADIPELGGDATPAGAVPGLRPGNRVRHLVEEDLMNLVVLKLRGEVARHSDAVICEVALPRPPLCVIEPK